MLKLFWICLYALMASVSAHIWLVADLPYTGKAMATAALWLFFSMVAGGVRAISEKEREGQR